MSQARRAENPEESLRLLPEAEPMAVRDIRDSLVIRERDMFLITDRTGRVPRNNPNGYGLYHADTRYLSEYAFSFSTARPVVLLSTAEKGYSEEQVLANPAMNDLAGREIPPHTIEARRTRAVDDVLEEQLDISNFGTEMAELELLYRFAADFQDIFEIRGYEPDEPGPPHLPAVADGSVLFSHEGRDGRARQTRVFFHPEPTSIESDAMAALATFRLTLEPRQTVSIRLIVTVDERMEKPFNTERSIHVAKRYAEWLDEATRVETDNRFFNVVLDRSLSDMRMLWTNDPQAGAYPAAGTPWYDTLFGRDTCIAALQTLAFRPEIARVSLRTLSRWQGNRADNWRDEDAGKILHELRKGELTQSGELPFSPYYGTIDATALYLWLAGEYYNWTGDLELIAEIEGNLRAALQWMDDCGDTNSDGFIDYEKRSAKGLVNQGWKDSHDSIVHSDGRILEPPIALAEVQAYTYAALTALIPVFEAMGDTAFASQLATRATELRKHFNREFWLEEEGFYALAIDGASEPSASISSNAGQALWPGIATRERAAQVVQRLMRDDMFSGWGIRTLSRESVRFNPQGYHLGTVWPHDNSIIAMGFKRYGFEGELNALASGLFDAAIGFPDYRLPELFGGERRTATHMPVPYPVACRPQAWAAGTFPLLTQAILGLDAHAPSNKLRIVRPALPDWLHTVRVERLRVGRGEVDLKYERDGGMTNVSVLAVRGDVEVEETDRFEIAPPLTSAQPEG